MDIEYLYFIDGCDNPCLRLLSRPFWDQTCLSFWIGRLCDRLFPMRAGSVAGMADRGPRVAGIWRRCCTAVGTCATVSSVPAKRAGDGAGLFWYRPSVRACPGPDFGRLAGGC